MAAVSAAGGPGSNVLVVLLMRILAHVGGDLAGLDEHDLDYRGRNWFRSASPIA